MAAERRSRIQRMRRRLARLAAPELQAELDATRRKLKAARRQLDQAGGRIALDDYYTWSGCRRAVDEYFADRDGFTLEHGAKLRIIRG